MDSPMEDQQTVHHFWQECLLARVLSFRNRTPTSDVVDFALGLSDFDRNDLALENYLAGLPKSVPLQAGQNVNVFTESGITRDTKIVDVVSASFSSLFGNPTGEGGSQGTLLTRNVPACYCSFDGADAMQQTPLHACLVRSRLPGQIKSPALLPRTKADRLAKTMMECCCLRRGSFAKTVDGVVRHIMLNDIDCCVLIDDHNVGFGYAKVVDTRFRADMEIDRMEYSRFLCTDSDCVREVVTPTATTTNTMDTVFEEEEGTSMQVAFTTEQPTDNVPRASRDAPTATGGGKNGTASTAMAADDDTGAADGDTIVGNESAGPS